MKEDPYYLKKSSRWLLPIFFTYLCFTDRAIGFQSLSQTSRTCTTSTPKSTVGLYAGTLDEEGDPALQVRADNFVEDLDETKRLVQAQQEKIDLLTALLFGKENTDQNQRSSIPSESASFDSPHRLPPQKVMIFIDGTWMYYSAHERGTERDPIVQRYGDGWQWKYKIDWNSLPRIICQALGEQDKARGWSAIFPGSEANNGHTPVVRPFQVSRVSVYTSYKADTSKLSFRYKMFQEMLGAKYDVHMMETVGRGEKCVDIQLAVDMLHYATVPDAYDVAILLSGDKDFVPALARCRQKGRRVGIVSMRTACNRAMIETSNIKDYDVIWLEDYLDELIKPRHDIEKRHRDSSISLYTLMRIAADFVEYSGEERIQSRDVGRYLKTFKVGTRNVLEEVKEVYGGLYQFLIVSSIFMVDRDETIRKHFWVALRSNAYMLIAEEDQKTTLTDEEKEFFNTYNPQDTVKRYMELKASDTKARVVLPEMSTTDYSNYKVAALKDFCRARGLPVSGKKSDLIERLTQYELQGAKEQNSSELQNDIGPAEYFDGLVSEYLQVKGGKSSSREVGRYLAANKASPKRMEAGGAKTKFSALSELKEIYGSIRQFAIQSEKYDIEAMESDEEFEYCIKLKS